MNNNQKRILEVKAMVISLIEKLIEKNGDESEKKASYEEKIIEIERTIKVGVSGLNACTCEEEEDSDTGFKNYMNGKRITCFNCLTKYMARERREIARKADTFGLGVPVVLDEEESYRSLGNTSSSDEEEKISSRRASYAKQKMLRKLRRQNPEPFDLNLLMVGEQQLVKAGLSDRGSQTGLESTQDMPPAAQQPKKPAALKDFDLYAGGKYNFSDEIELKRRLSSSVFNFLTNTVHFYQNHLKENKKSKYSNITEVMLKSGQFLNKEEEKVISHYYSVLRKKGRAKSIKSSDTRPLTVSAESSGLFERVYDCTFTDTKVSEEVIQEAKRTGRIDLKSHSLLGVPDAIWSIDETPVAAKKSANVKDAGTGTTRWYRSLFTLDLSHNQIETFCAHGKSLNTLFKLCLTGNQIEELPYDFGEFRNLKYLALDDNQLKKLPRTFSQLVNLVYLNLRENILRDLPKNIGNLKKLTVIDLRWNKLYRLPDSIIGLESLKIFNVAFNRLKNLPESLSNLYHLTIIDVSYNRLKDLPVVNDLPKLVLLNVMGNYIKIFPRITNCKSLYEIRFDGNRLKTFAAANMINCPVIQLTLAYNKIREIPADIVNLETLVVLDLTSNNLTRLPRSIVRLRYLACLKVDQNHIENVDKESVEAGTQKILLALEQIKPGDDPEEELVAKPNIDVEVIFSRKFSVNKPATSAPPPLDPKEVQRTNALIRRRLNLSALNEEWITEAREQKVSTVDISKNNFRFIPNKLKRLAPFLKHLFVRSNRLTTIPDFVGRMFYLVTLDLTGNKLKSVPLSLGNCQLTTLICKRNSFSAIPKVLFTIYSIEVLDFSENNLENIDTTGLKQLKCLTHLNLSKNYIRVLPCELGYFYKIQNLDVTGNRFLDPNKQLLKQGTQAVLNYLRQSNCAPQEN